MLKNSHITINQKIRCVISFSQLKSELGIKAKIDFTEHHIQLTLYPKNPTSSELLKNIFYPIKYVTTNILQINYILIKNAAPSRDCTELRFDVVNPVMHSEISFFIFNIEENGIMFKRKYKKNQIANLSKIIMNAKITERKWVMNNFINLVYLFKDALETEENKNLQLENILIPSYVYGRNYYEKNICVYKQNLKLKTSLKKSLIDKIKILESMQPEQEQVKQNLSCSNFDNLLNEFKVRAFVYIEESITLFFAIINLENNTFSLQKMSNAKISNNLRALNDINLNCEELNKSAHLLRGHNKESLFDKFSHHKVNSINLSNDCYIKQGVNSKKNCLLRQENFSSSTKTTSKKKENIEKETLETPKFYALKQKYIMNSKNKTIQAKGQIQSMQNIIKQIENLTQNHSLVPPVNAFNIFLNTTEIIHRAFFEIALKTLKCDIFTIELDNNKIMKIDSIYNHFLFLRNLKNFLFSDGNSTAASSLIYIDEE